MEIKAFEDEKVVMSSSAQTTNVQNAHEKLGQQISEKAETAIEKGIFDYDLTW